MKAAISLFCVSTLLVWTACHPIDKHPVTGGKGGHYTVLAQPWVNGKWLNNSTVYIKYASVDAPANNIYDDSAVCVMVDTIPTATFSGLTAGTYYLYVKGYDTINGHIQLITGGAHVPPFSGDTVVVHPPAMEL